MPVPPTAPRALDDPSRLAALSGTALVPGLRDPLFDPYVELVQRLLDVPGALVTFVAPDQQFFAAGCGVEEPWASRNRTPLSLSFCQHVVATDAVLAITDAILDDRVSEIARTEGVGVRAYLGAPLRGPGGEPLGSLCAIDSSPREWTEQEVSLITSVAAAAATAIALRTTEHRHATLGRQASHELRTPITGLMLELENALAGSGETARDHVRAAIERVQEVSVAVDAMIRHMRSDPPAGVTPQDLSALVGGVIEEQRPRLAPTGRALHLVVHEPVEVVVNPNALERIVGLLLDNAVEHGEGTITVVADGGPGVVRVVVMDEGTAVPDLDQVLTSGPRGSDAGGLAVASEIARALGGRLRVLDARTTSVELLLPR